MRAVILILAILAIAFSLLALGGWRFDQLTKDEPSFDDARRSSHLTSLAACLWLIAIVLEVGWHIWPY